MVDLFLNYADTRKAEVVDPYYGDMQDFKAMFEQLEANCDLIVKRIQEQL